MHQRHYPAVTVVLASALTVLPVGLLLLLNHHRSVDDSAAFTDADVQSPITRGTERVNSAVDESAAAGESPHKEDPVVGADALRPPAVEPRQVTDTTHKAEQTAGEAGRETKTDPQADPEPAPQPARQPLLASLLHAFTATSHQGGEDVPHPPDIKPAVTSDVQGKTQHQTPQTLDNPMVPSPSAGQSTLLSQSPAGVSGPMHDPEQPGHANDSMPMTGGSETMMGDRKNMKPRMPPSSPNTGVDPGQFLKNGAADKSEIPDVYEDVLLQSPAAQRPVNRIENVVANTTASGWPIALVKSELPDDVWWVQQMVGIRGKSFAARVNFGNGDTLPGSRFELVFVFLDSQEEVRRFRIAKQFKELPEGVRKSRTYTFVRR